MGTMNVAVLSAVVSLAGGSVGAVDGLSLEQVVGELRAFVEAETAADRFSGTVLLARDGEVLFQGAYGLASRRFDVPNAIDTKFNLGSMNKMFTCVAAMQLVQEGELDLDDPVSNWLDETWLAPELAAKIQVRHLMTHTSGLGSYFNRKYVESSRALYRELADYKPLVYQDTLAFEPGTGWSYSNTGMFLLGAVLEAVTERNYFELVREEVHRPAGMADTDCYEMDRPVKNLAIGYTQRDGEWFNNLYAHVLRGGPAGGGFSTAPDLLAFDQALRNLVLLDQEHTEMLWSPKPELGSPGYAFGFSVQESAAGRIVGHGGGFEGISSNLDMYLDSGFTVVVLSNVDGGATLVNGKIRELVMRMGE